MVFIVIVITRQITKQSKMVSYYNSELSLS